MKTHSRSRCGHGMAFSNRMRSTDMFSKYAWSLYIWKHSTSKVSPKKCSFLSEMSCAQTLTRFVWVCTYENTAERRGTKHCKQKRPVKNRWSRRTGGEVHADPPAWIFPVQACDSNYITLKQIQIIDTLVKLPPLTELSHTSKSSTDRSDAHTRLQEQDLHVAWNVQYVVIFVLYHSLRRESVKSTDSGSVTGVKSVRPTWFQDTTAARGPPSSLGQGTPEPMYGGWWSKRKRWSSATRLLSRGGRTGQTGLLSQKHGNATDRILEERHYDVRDDFPPSECATASW